MILQVALLTYLLIGALLLAYVADPEGEVLQEFGPIELLVTVLTWPYGAYLLLYGEEDE